MCSESKLNNSKETIAAGLRMPPLGKERILEKYKQEEIDKARNNGTSTSYVSR